MVISQKNHKKNILVLTSTSLTGTAHLRVSLSFALVEVEVLGSTSEDRPFTATHTNKSFSKINLLGFDLEKRPLVLNSNCITSSSLKRNLPDPVEYCPPELVLSPPMSDPEDGPCLGVDSFPEIDRNLSLKIREEKV